MENIESRGMFEMLFSDFEWLIEQAERVRDLESELEKKNNLLSEVFITQHKFYVGAMNFNEYQEKMEEISQLIYDVNNMGQVESEVE